MSERLENRAEIVKLARLLGVEPVELDFLAVLPARALREYRERASDRLFEADAAMFRRVGAAAELFPSALVALIAQRAFGPLLCAHVVGTVDTSTALDVLRRVPPEFVADATIEVDPRRVVDLIAVLPEETVVSVARVLGERREYVTVGRFLAFVPDHGLVSAVGVLSDEALVRTAFVLEHKERLDHAVALLPAGRLPGVIRRASELGLWSEVLDLLDHLSDRRRGPIADVVAEQDESVVSALVEAVADAGIWDSLLPVVRTMSEEARIRLAGMAPFHDPRVMRDIIWAAADQGLWVDLVPLIDALQGAILTEVGRVAVQLDSGRLSKILTEATAAPSTLPTLLSLVSSIEEEVRAPVLTAVADVLAEQDEQVVAALLESITAARAWDSLFPMVGAMSEESRARLAAMAPFHDPIVIREIVGAAADQGLWVELVPLMNALPVDVRPRLAEIAATLEPERLDNVVRDAAGAQLTLAALLSLASQMEDADRARVIAAIDRADRGVAEQLVTRLSEPEQLGELHALITPDVMTAIERAAERLGMQKTLRQALHTVGERPQP